MKIVTNIGALACGVALTVAAQATPQHVHEHDAAPAATSAVSTVPYPPIAGHRMPRSRSAYAAPTSRSFS